MIYLLCLNWNTSDMLIRMYHSALDNAEKEFNFIIVDNGSVQSEYDKLLKYGFKNCVVIRNQQNLGFAAGNNKGLSVIKDETGSIIFINSDIVIQEKAWDVKFKAILNQADVGVAGCAYHPLEWSRDGHFKIQAKVNYPIESESVQGAFFGIKKIILDKIQKIDGCYFDENFKFAHYEETDLCFRIMHQLGTKCIWFPLIHVHDYQHSSCKKHSYHLNAEIKNEADFKRNSEKNRLLLLEKHKNFFARKFI